MNKNSDAGNPVFGERVRKIRGGMGQVAFGKLIGVSQGNVSKIERGMVPEADILLRIAEHGGTTIEYLLSGWGPLRASIIGHNENDLPPGMSLIKKLKYPGSAGHGLQANDEIDIQLAFRDDWLSKFGGPDKLLAMVIEGDSMEPTLQDQDVVVVNKNVLEIKPGGGIYAFTWQGKRMVKRLQINPQTKIVHIKCDNENYDDLTADLADLCIEGKLIWFGREMK